MFGGGEEVGGKEGEWKRELRKWKEGNRNERM